MRGPLTLAYFLLPWLFAIAISVVAGDTRISKHDRKLLCAIGFVLLAGSGIAGFIQETRDPFD